MFRNIGTIQNLILCMIMIERKNREKCLAIINNLKFGDFHLLVVYTYVCILHIYIYIILFILCMCFFFFTEEAIILFKNHCTMKIDSIVWIVKNTNIFV